MIEMIASIVMIGALLVAGVVLLVWEEGVSTMTEAMSMIIFAALVIVGAAVLAWTEDDKDE